MLKTDESWEKVVVITLLTIALLSILATQAYGRCNQTFRVGWKNWMPFAFSPDSTSNNATGLDVEILKAVMEAIGCDFEFSPNEIPWKRQLLGIENGKLDIVFGVFKEPEREKYGFYTDQYRSRSVGFFVRRGQVKKWARISSIEDLPDAKISIGVVRGYSYGIRVNRILRQMSNEISVVNNPVQHRRMLVHKRFDGYLAYLPDELIYLNENDLDHKIQHHPMAVVYTGGIHFFLSKKSTSPATVALINKGLKTIKANGRYDQIIKKYSLLYGIDEW